MLLRAIRSATRRTESLTGVPKVAPGARLRPMWIGVIWLSCLVPLLGCFGCSASATTRAGRDAAFDRPPTAAGTLPGGRSPFLSPPAAQCRLGDCNRHGWTATMDGRTVTAVCIASDCPRRGWTIVGATGSFSAPQCRFSDCERHGFTTLSSDGRNVTTSCPFSDCNKNGWTTVYPDGRMETCRCRYRDCPKYGADCS